MYFIHKYISIFLYIPLSFKASETFTTPRYAVAGCGLPGKTAGKKSHLSSLATSCFTSTTFLDPKFSATNTHCDDGRLDVALPQMNFTPQNGVRQRDVRPLQHLFPLLSRHFGPHHRKESYSFPCSVVRRGCGIQSDPATSSCPSCPR